MNTSLNRHLHALLNRLGLMDDKPLLVEQLTGGRTMHSHELSDREARELIARLEHLAGNEQRTRIQRQRRRILSICHQLGWYERDEQDNIKLYGGKPRLDMARINRFCTERGHGHKPLNSYRSKELRKLIYQFEQVLKTDIKHA